MNRKIMTIGFVLFISAMGFLLMDESFAQKRNDEINLNAPPAHQVWRDSMADLHESLRALNEKNADLEQENDILRKKIQGLQNDLKKIKKGQQISEERIPGEVVTVDLVPEEPRSVVKRQIQDSPEALSQLKKEKVALNDELLMKQRRFNQLQKEKNELVKKIAESRKQLQRLEKSPKAEKKTSISVQESQTEDFRKEMKDLLSQQNELKIKTQQAQENLEKVLAELKSYETAPPLTSDELKNLKNVDQEIKVLTSQNQDFKKRLRSLNDLAKKLQMDSDRQVSSEQKQWAERAASLQKENELLKKEIDTLTQLIKTLRDKKIRVESSLENQKR